MKLFLLIILKPVKWKHSEDMFLQFERLKSLYINGKVLRMLRYYKWEQTAVDKKWTTKSWV